MEPAHPTGAFEYDSDASPENILVQLDSYIVALVHRMAWGNSNVGRPDVFWLEVDEITQRIRIKFYDALLCRRIEYPRAYLRTIVLNEFRDLSRKRKAPLPLQTDDDGELFMGDMVIVGSEEADNPEDEYIEKEGLLEILEVFLPCISEMSPRQRRVIFCRIYEALGERLDDIEAFRRYAIDRDIYVWPLDEHDKQLLQASLSAARKNLLKKIDNMLEKCEQVKVPKQIKALATR
jgi:DNA-directed RNA polymerase specialized sigma24 family protein